MRCKLLLQGLSGDRPTRMILQQWWEDGWRQVGEWRDVAVEVEG